MTMALTTALIEAQFRSARGIFAGAVVGVRFGGREVQGIRSSTEQSDRPGAMGSLEGVDGAVRVLVSELPQPHPKQGDAFQIKEPTAAAWQSRRVALGRYDQVGATLRLDYVDEHQ